MKRPVAKLDEAIVRRGFPLASELDGGFFRLRELSNGVWQVDGTDLWRRTVSTTGEDERAVLVECVAMAREVKSRLAGG